MAKTEVICNNCGTLFQKENKEINRTNKTNGQHYCTMKCNLDKNRNYHEASSVTTNARKRADKKGLEFNLSKDFVADLLIKQNGKCALSGINIYFSPYAEDKDIYQASLDRIDNDKGYTTDNVQLVALGINYMKNTFTDEKAAEFINKLRGV